MIDIRFIPDEWERIDTFFGAFYTGETIAIGCSDIEYCELLIKDGYLIEPFRHYENVSDLILGTVEQSLTHETIHIIINRWFGVGVSHMLDNIDERGEISDNCL